MALRSKFLFAGCLALLVSGPVLARSGGIIFIPVGGAEQPVKVPINHYALAVDAGGTVYEADADNNVIRKITPDGVMTVLAGNATSSGAADGAGTEAAFNCPQALAVDAAGNVYVADTYNHSIRKITPDGVVTTLAGTPGRSGNRDGALKAARFNQPEGIAVDTSGNIYVADTGNRLIRKITAAGVVSTVAGADTGLQDGVGAAASFKEPRSIAVAADGTLFVTDATLRRISPAGEVTTIAGTSGPFSRKDGDGADAHGWEPSGLAVDTHGNLYVADSRNHVVRMLAPGKGLAIFAGQFAVKGGADGNAATATFLQPGGMALDAGGALYVIHDADGAIRRISASGVVSTLLAAQIKCFFSCGSIPKIPL
ncbi:MAG: NHL repeat-containing protein [bacterium]|nr:NHL repeat-containing protein [bacterium]